MSDCEGKEKKDCKKKNNCSWKKKTNKCSSIRPIATRKKQSTITENVEETSELLENNPSVESKISEEMRMNAELYSESSESSESKAHKQSSESQKAQDILSVCSQPNVGGPCEEHKQLLEDRKHLNERIRIKNKECEEIRHKNVEDYFEMRAPTHRDLLDVLFRFYKKNKIDTPLDLQDFIRMFRRDTNSKLNCRRHHVFEAVCRLLLLFNYDNKFGNVKTFYESLERFSSNNKIGAREILNTKVNEGNAGGIVDIFFEQDLKEIHENNCKENWMCDCKEPNAQELDTMESHETTRKFILIQNKYYDSEKAVESGYNLSDIMVLANNKLPPDSYKIVLMVNNSEALDKKIQRSKRRKEVDVYGVREMSDWFYKLLLDFKRVDTFEQFLDEKLGDGYQCLYKDNIRPKLHQMFFTNTTMVYHNEQHYKMFIWGAVPRSGKSYMIGDFITKNYERKPEERDNDIVLILGAKTETESQFKAMFAGCSISGNYNIILAGDKSAIIEDKKSIFILSQEFFKKDKLIVNIDGNWTFKNKNPIINRLLSGRKRIDLFFDEIHKGGSTDKSQNILNAFKSAKITIDIFVMVTATFGKPSLRYETSFIDTEEKGIKLVEWGYEDQQNMKNIQTKTDIRKIVNSKKINDRDTIESTILQNVFDHYEERYGKENLIQVITDDYKHHPEIVIVQPDMSSLVNPEQVYPTCSEIFKLNCSACDMTQSPIDIRSPSNIFQNEQAVIDLIRFIGNVNDSVLDDKCVYHQLYKMKAPITKSHSEIWFLPDKDLYKKDDEDDCNVCKKVEIEDNQDEDDKKQSGLPNIEPLTRGLALLLMSQPYFERKYNVIIIHNTKLKLVNRETQQAYSELFTRDKIYLFDNKKGVSDQIKDAERKTFSQNKSLIILTGAKLRLGISLPCVDIAFNFDNISSIDSNYQTMFRVLTERQYQTKKYGYYVDLNHNRAIQFLYDYNNIYSVGKKLDSKKKTKYLQYLLHIFNYNGLGILKQDAIKEAKMYSKMIEEMKLDENSYNQYTMSGNGIATLFSKIMNFDYSLIENLKKIIIPYTSGKIPKLKVVIKDKKEGKKKKKNDDDDDSDDDSDDDLMDDNTFIQTISIIIPAIPTLLGLFTTKEGLEESIVECISNLVTLSDDSLCSCDGDVSNINGIACYMNAFQKYNKVRLIQLLEIVLEILKNQQFNQIGMTIKNIFVYIKDNMGKHKGALIFHMTPEEIQSKIEEYLPVRKEEKDKFGEVFTPIDLINEMMEKLSPTVWQNPRLTWLDPASGIGNFPMVVYNRLMDSLPDTYNKDDIKYSTRSDKSKHILTKMIYMCEINAKNVKIAKDTIFGQDANICCCDFLEEEKKWKSQFGKTSFDIIIGNPPFQTEIVNISERGKGSRTLWDKFIVKSLELINEGGILGFITPPPWRKPESKLYKLMTQDNQLSYLHIYGEKQGQTLFNVSQRFDLYIVEKIPKYKNTQIVDEVGNKIVLDLSKWIFLPNYAYDVIQHIITTEHNSLQMVYDSSTYHNQDKYVSTERTPLYKYPVVHSITSHGPGYLYSSIKSVRHFDIKKVILSSNSIQYPINDYAGKYGTSNNTFFIPITSKKQGNDMVAAINSDGFKEIIKATKWGTFQTDYKMFKYFKPDFYKYFLLPSTSTTKIQSVVRGKKTKKGRKKDGRKTKRQLK